jgi:hypothetical protein
MNGSVHDDALLLLLATKHIYAMDHPCAKLQPGEAVDPQGACERIGWGATPPRCEAALEYLEAEQALERSATTVRAVGTNGYVWGSGAADMLGEE